MTESDSRQAPFFITTDSDSRQAPFYVTKAEDRQLRVAADLLSPSLLIDQASSFDEYVRQMMVPPAVMDLARKAANIRLAAWESQALREQFEPALTDDERPRLLREILRRKSQEDPSHPPYVRVACTGRGKYDDLAEQYGYDPTLPMAGDSGDFGSPVVLELWPAGHYSPMHSHGNTTGIIYCLAGQLDVMSYRELDWNADRRGLVTLTPGRCAWLSGDTYDVHKVFCPMDGGRAVRPDQITNTADFAASFHVYLDEHKLSMDHYEPYDPESAVPDSVEVFSYVDESEPHLVKPFRTYSDLSWRALRMVLAKTALDQFRRDPNGPLAAELVKNLF
ncbi:hypothetical protein ACFC0M_23740 [Streptomyces sp. NPDC056149]|uniref:hypothetical protein n=1 Tax=unclassified Streptomyces TaxID=2593676 RepID=UPI0023812A59|nr:hypothetical protein [Streptomyces sp. WZ-12]